MVVVGLFSVNIIQSIGPFLTGLRPGHNQTSFRGLSVIAVASLLATS